MPNGQKILTVDFSDEKYSLLTDFFISDGTNFAERIITIVDEVLNGRMESDECSGNVFEIHIYTDG